MRITTQRSVRGTNALLAAVLGVSMLVLAWGISVGNVYVAIFVGVVAALCFVLVGTVNLVPDDSRSEATERTLRVAVGTLEHLRGGLTADNAQAICALLLPETNATGIAITNKTHVLACAGTVDPAFVAGSENARSTLEVLESKRMETFVAVDKEDGKDIRRLGPIGRRGDRTYGVVVPLLVQDRAVGTVKFYYARDLDIDRTQLAIGQGLGSLLSTQLSAYELDLQAELTARAEVKALQAQINPHFLFNTLNTIASLCRTDPMKARAVLRAFPMFYRRTLESSEKTLIPLEQELEQPRRYLTIEKARFGESRIVESEHVEPGCEALPVPSFLVQPIVENAVRHAMRDTGPLNIDIHVAADGDDILIAVADDGLGMTQEVADRLLEKPATMGASGQKGTGMALRNVAERIERFFDAGSGVEVVSKPGEGTCVTLKLVGARLNLARKNQTASA